MNATLTLLLETFPGSLKTYRHQAETKTRRGKNIEEFFFF